MTWRAGRVRPLPLAGMLVLSVLLAGSLWVVPYLPTNDGAEWVFASHIENHYADPESPYPLQYVPALQFAARGFTVLLDPFEAWLGWQHGLQAALTVTVLFAAWGFVALVYAVDARRAALAFLGFPLALSWEFYMGFWAFVVGSALGLFILAIAVRLREATWRGRALLAGLLFVQAVAHVFTAVLAGAALLALALARAPRGARFAETARVALMGLPAAGILVASVLAGGTAASVTFMDGFGRLAWRDVLSVLPQTFAPGPFARGVVVLLFVAAAAALAIARARRPDTSATDRAFGLVAAIFLGAAVVAPRDVPGWQFFSERFVPMGAALAIVALPVEDLRGRVARWASPSVFGASALFLFFTYPFHKRFASLTADAVAGLSAPVHRSLEQLPIVLTIAEDPSFDSLHADVPMVQPLMHMGALYAAVQGGLIPFVFSSSPATYPFVNRRDTILRQPGPDLSLYWTALASGRFQRDRRFRHAFEDERTVDGASYEGIVLLGAHPDDVALWVRRGYAVDWMNRSVLVAHFEGCDADVAIPASVAQPAPSFDVRVGGHAFLSDKRVPGRRGDDGLVHFELARTPCGDVSVRARRGDGAEGALCANADREGWMEAVLSRGARTVSCAAGGAAPAP